MAVALVVVLFPAGTTETVLADADASATLAPLSVSECSTMQLSDVLAAYTSTPAPHTHPVPLPPQTRSYLASVLRARLKQCSQKMQKDAAVPGSRVTPADACDPRDVSNVRILWQQLRLCEALVNPQLPTPTMLGWKLPPTVGYANQPVIFVMGAGGGDPAMLAKLVSTLAQYLSQTASYLDGNAKLIAAPTLALSDFIGYCANSQQVKGAIIVTITAAGSGATDAFIYRRNWTAIEANALYADCQRPVDRPKANGVPAVVWTSDLAQGQKHYDFPTPLTPIALLLTLGAAYEEFAPSRSTSTVTTRIFPTPLPIPTYGRISQVQTTNGQTLNASSLSSVAIGFLSSSISYTNASAPLTQSPTVDQQTWDTLQDIGYKLVAEMNCWQPPTEAIGGQQPLKDIVGQPRKVPGYKPPPGLNYASGEPSAPFCAEPVPTASPSTGESIQDILPPTPTPASTPTPAPHR